MKILFPIARADTIAGAQVHVRDLAVALQRDGHQVLVVTGQEGIYNLALDKAQIKSIACETLQPQISPLKDWASLKFLLEVIKSFQPDLIAAHSSKTGILGRLAAKIAKIPCVFTAHGWSFTAGVPQPNRTIYRVIETLTAPLTNKIICVSECDRNIALKSGINSQILSTIHNGMADIPESLQAHPGDRNPVNIVMVARFDRQKDHQTLIEAVKDLTEARLILVGDGPNLESMKALAVSLGIAERVEFLGFRNDIAEILARSQIYILISNWEGLPCTIIEAMRAGLPVVASDVGGVAELIVDGETGYLISSNNPDILKQKLANLTNNPTLRQTMGDRGRQRYQAEFTFDRMYAKTLELYRQAIGNY
jgi:glycosyltransferase involved in cell wall biosynthesis